MAKQLLLDALHGKRTETTPWMVYAGTHMGYLIGETVDNYFQDPDLLVKGVTTCAERYKADGIPLCADLQIEAMALGCGYKWGKTDTPQVISHPCENMQPKEAGLKIPTSADGRFPVVVEAGKKMKPILDDMDVALIGFIAGPCTLAEHLIGGTKFYKSFYKERERMAELFQFVSEVILASTRIYMNEIGCDIIAWVDPTATQLSEKDFREFVTPALQSSIAEVHAAGKTSSFWLWGNCTKIIRAMIETGAQSVAVDELMSLPYVANVATELGAGFCGNIRTTDGLMFQFISPREDALACMATGSGRPGFVLGTGSPIPYDVDPKNVEMVVEAKEWFDNKYRKKYPHYDPFVDTAYPVVEEKIPKSLITK